MTFKSFLINTLALIVTFPLLLIVVGYFTEANMTDAEVWGDEPYFCERVADNADVLRRGGESGMLRVETTPEYCSYLQSKNPEWKLTR